MRTLAAASCVAALLTAGLTVSAAGGAVSRTSLHLYAPFNGGKIAAGIRVARSASGYCWTSSNVAARSDAFRCFVGNVIHDPCFADRNGIARSFVLCPLYVPTSRVLRIRLTKPLPANDWSGDPTTHQPWALQLADGRWCTEVSGATGSIAGLRIGYACAGGAVLLGNPRRGVTWTIFRGASYRAASYGRVAMRAAWW